MIRQLALGDSYTAGTGVTAAESWPAQLAKLLREQGLSVAEPALLAQNGCTSNILHATLQRALARTDFQHPFDFITVLIGTNDQYDGCSLTEYGHNFRGLLERAIGIVDSDPARVIVLSLPDWSVTPFATGRDRDNIAAQIKHFNTVNRRESERAGARYLNITPISRRAANDVSLLAEDNLHPSAKMCTAWARLLLPVVLDIL